MSETIILAPCRRIHLPLALSQALIKIEIESMPWPVSLGAKNAPMIVQQWFNKGVDISIDPKCDIARDLIARGFIKL